MSAIEGVAVLLPKWGVEDQNDLGRRLVVGVPQGQGLVLAQLWLERDGGRDGRSRGHDHKVALVDALFLEGTVDIRAVDSGKVKNIKGTQQVEYIAGRLYFTVTPVMPCSTLYTLELNLTKSSTSL